MKRPLHVLDDETLGRAIAGLDLDWPAPGAGLADRVRTRAVAVPSRQRRRTARFVLLAAAVVILLAGAAVAARLVFDLGAITIEPAPSGRPLPTSSALPTWVVPSPWRRPRR